MQTQVQSKRTFPTWSRLLKESLVLLIIQISAKIKPSEVPCQDFPVRKYCKDLRLYSAKIKKSNW